jgi:hypothetical protein
MGQGERRKDDDDGLYWGTVATGCGLITILLFVLGFWLAGRLQAFR